MRIIPIIEKKDRVKKKDAEWFDKNTQNPGQLGEQIQIKENRDQKIPGLKPEKYVKTWKVEKKKKKKSKKVKKVDASMLNSEQLLRFNKNMVTVELSSKDYEPSEVPSGATRPQTHYSEISS